MGKPRVRHSFNLSALVAFALSAVPSIAVAPPASAEDAISESALKQIMVLEQQKAERSPAQAKMDSQLLYGSQRSALRMVAPALEPDLKMLEDGRILVDITTAAASDSPTSEEAVHKGPSRRAPGRARGVTAMSRERVPLLRRIESLGGTVVNAFPQYRAIRAIL